MTVKAGSDTPEAFYERVTQHYVANQVMQHPVVQQQRELNGRQDGKPYLPYSQVDALLGELLREVLEMRQQVAALQDGLQDITEAMRTQQRDALKRNLPRINELLTTAADMVARSELPPNALRHGAPR